jgi:hypothetical protein
MSESINAGISFEQALQETNNFLDLLSSGTLKEAEIEHIVSLLVKSENGARGFFVNYLTTEQTYADHPSTGILKGLQSSPEIVSELLVKNLAMSTATIVAHHQNGDHDLAQGSQTVQKRTLTLLKELNLPESQLKLAILAETLKTGHGQYQPFLERWGYDQQQKDAIAQILPSGD